MKRLQHVVVAVACLCRFAQSRAPTTSCTKLADDSWATTEEQQKEDSNPRRDKNEPIYTDCKEEMLDEFDESSNGQEVSSELREAVNNPPDTLPYFKEAQQRHQTEAKKTSAKDAARQRWKILCLVKTSDTVADETARQEKLKEKVDEWMSNMVCQMKVVEDDVVGGVNGLRLNEEDEDEASSGRSSPLVPKIYKEELQEIRRQTEREQLKRIRAREQLEVERERLLVLEGKMEMRPEHREDPVLKLHLQFQQLEKKAKAHQERKLRRKKRRAKTKAIKMKWTSAKDKLKLNNFVMMNNSGEGPETVMANLVYDEKSDRLTSSSKPLDGDNDKEEKVVHPNPVFQAFDGADCVDDLYRIAEIYVNPATYYFD